ncbi:MAG TPA: DNA repair protein RadA [bacterium]
MVKKRTVFSCQKCGFQTPKWLGRCPECGEWNSLVEETYESPPENQNRQAMLSKGEVKKLNEISVQDLARIKTGVGEFDTVLGGGIVPASFVLVGGDPGIGKSTLLLQAAGSISEKGSRVLYVSGEESYSQIKMRAQRLGINAESLFILCETCLENIFEAIEKINPAVLILDSVQTTYTSELTSAPGSVSQVRETAGRLMVLTKNRGIMTFIIGHVTKEGSIAGPRVLEHIVDTVLYFEGDAEQQFRILRSHKNRFGPVSEIGVFRMGEGGLIEVTNPSEFLLSGRTGNVSGSVVVCSMEGTRPLLIEVQALASSTPFPTPRRNIIGFDPYRVNLLIAILEKRSGNSFFGYDIFLNTAGGIKINESASDLGVITALYSSFKDKPVDSKTIVIGEVSLAGEVRAVPLLDERIKEAQKLGFTKAIIPARNRAEKKKTELKVVEAAWIKEAISELFG